MNVIYKCVILFGALSSLTGAFSAESPPILLPEANAIELLIYPERIVPKTNVIPELLEQILSRAESDPGFLKREKLESFQYKKIVSGNNKEWGVAVDAFKRTKWSKWSGHTDYRYGLHVKRDSVCIQKLYVDRINGALLVDGKTYKVKGGILDWLKGIAGVD